MKIVKPGRDQKGWAQEVSCSVAGGCAAVLLVEQADLFHPKTSEDSDPRIGFECGACGMTNWLDQKTVNTVPNYWNLPERL